MPFYRNQDIKSSLLVGDIKSPHVNEHMREVIRKIATDYPDVVFCGSLGLIINGKLDRPIKDIDLITPEDFYRNHPAFYPEFRISDSGSSCTFQVGESFVTCFKVRIMGINIDVLHNLHISPIYKLHPAGGINIKVEEPRGAIEAKLGYILHDKSPVSMAKHIKDLFDMGIPLLDITKVLAQRIVPTKMPELNFLNND